MCNYRRLLVQGVTKQREVLRKNLLDNSDESTTKKQFSTLDVSENRLGLEVVTTAIAVRNKPDRNVQVEAGLHRHGLEGRVKRSLHEKVEGLNP